MKKIMTTSIFVITILFFASCNTKHAADESLKDDTHRTKVISTIVKDPTYSKEMIDMMLSDDNCKSMMTQHMIEHPEMKNKMMDKMMTMCKNDSSMCKMMLNKTMGMCEIDTLMCKRMTNSMKEHLKVMKSVKECCDMDTREHHRGDKMGHNK